MTFNSNYITLITIEQDKTQKNRQMKSIFSYFSSGFIHVCVFPWFPGQKCGSCFWCDLILLSGSHIVPFSLRRKGPVKHTHTHTNLLVVESCIELNQSIVLYYLWCGPMSSLVHRLKLQGRRCSRSATSTTLTLFFAWYFFRMLWILRCS